MTFNQRTSIRKLNPQIKRLAESPEITFALSSEETSKCVLCDENHSLFREDLQSRKFEIAHFSQIFLLPILIAPCCTQQSAALVRGAC